MCAQLLSGVQVFATPRAAAHQAPRSMEFFRQEYWSGFPFPPPGDLPNSGTESTSPALAGGFFTTEPPKNPPASVEVGSIPELGRSPGGGNGNPLQYSCLGNPMDREAWQATVHGVTKESDMTT